MSISIQLTDEQAKQLAADIIKLNKPDKPSPLPELPAEPSQSIPPFLLPFPPVPEGYKEWKFRGLGWQRGKGSPVAYKSKPNPEWNPLDDCAEGGEALYYLEAVKDETEPKPDTARREWDASININTGWLSQYHPRDEPRYHQKIRVREVLPGDPTPEQVQALVDACWGWRDIPHHEDIRAALAPFRKP